MYRGFVATNRVSGLMAGSRRGATMPAPPEISVSVLIRGTPLVLHPSRKLQCRSARVYPQMYIGERDLRRLSLSVRGEGRISNSRWKRLLILFESRTILESCVCKMADSSEYPRLIRRFYFLDKSILESHNFKVERKKNSIPFLKIVPKVFRFLRGRNCFLKFFSTIIIFNHSL